MFLSQIFSFFLKKYLHDYLNDFNLLILSLHDLFPCVSHGLTQQVGPPRTRLVEVKVLADGVDGTSELSVNMCHGQETNGQKKNGSFRRVESCWGQSFWFWMVLGTRYFTNIFVKKLEGLI